MGKRKNSMQSYLLANSLLFGVLSIVTIILGAFFLYFGLFFSVLTISAVSGEFALMTYLQSGIFISASLLIFYMFASNNTWFWEQWQRKQALDAEEARVSRLMDDSAEDERDFIEPNANSQQKKQ